MERIISDTEAMENVMTQCVKIKDDVVASDPTEKGLRKILNFGHTAGHAFESLSIERRRPLAHGEAVAHGILTELILSHMLKGFPSEEIYRYANEILKPHYPCAGIGCKDIPALVELMAHDKKNATFGRPNFTLLSIPGRPETDCEPEIKEIESALEIYCDITS